MPGGGRGAVRGFGQGPGWSEEDFSGGGIECRLLVLSWLRAQGYGAFPPSTDMLTRS